MKVISLKDSTENIYVRLPIPVLERLDHRCVDLRIRRPEALRRAVEDWLKGKKTQDEDESVKKLAVILTAGDPVAENAIRQFVDLCFDRLKPKKAAAKNTA